MATTTPNYGWDVPTSTDYVKDGATAIETLGDDIDASLFSVTGGKNVGMVHLNTTTFTAAATVQVNNVFTSAFDNYMFELRYTQNTSTANVRYQNSLSGTPAATNYGANGFVAYANGSSGAGLVSGGGGTSATNIVINNSLATGINFIVAHVSSPALAASTMYKQEFSASSTGFGGNTTGFVGGIHTTATAYDGMTLTTDGGTMTGTLRVYGLRNS